MKNKLFSRVLIIVSLCFMFSGCELLNMLLDDGSSSYRYKETKQTVNVPQKYYNSYVYLVKLNNSEAIIDKDYTGYVTARRSILADDEPATDKFLREQNQRLADAFVQTADRAADRAAGSKIVSGYNTTTYKLGDSKTFWAYVQTKTDKKGNEYNIPGTVKASCKYVGDHCYVFADNTDKNNSSKGINLNDTSYKSLGQKFDACYELETSVIGNPIYSQYHSTYFAPCNKKVIILVSDLFGDAYPEQQSMTAGYVYPANLYNKNYADLLNEHFKVTDTSDPDYIFTNECEIVYIDSLILSQKKETAYSTLVHEFNHMINYVIKTVNGMTANPGASSFTQCDVWFTEMLSMVTEDMFQDYLELEDKDSPKSRLPYFNMYYNYGYRLWNTANIPALVMYANTYAFGAYLARNFGGTELIKQIAQNEYVNEESITAALQACNPDYTYKDDITGKTRKIDYEYAMRKFCMCLFNTGIPSEEQLQATGDDQYFSFNRRAGKQSASLHFNPIDIMSIKCDVQNKDGSVSKDQIIKPTIYDPDQIVGLGPSGFSVHRIGRRVESFDLMMSNKEGLEYYLITAGVDL